MDFSVGADAVPITPKPLVLSAIHLATFPECLPGARYGSRSRLKKQMTQLPPAGQLNLAVEMTKKKKKVWTVMCSALY